MQQKSYLAEKNVLFGLAACLVQLVQADPQSLELLHSLKSQNHLTMRYIHYNRGLYLH
jgi:hypothetical protein